MYKCPQCGNEEFIVETVSEVTVDKYGLVISQDTIPKGYDIRNLKSNNDNEDDLYFKCSNCGHFDLAYRFDEEWKRSNRVYGL